METTFKNLQDEYRALDIEAGKYNRPEFDKVYTIIYELVKDMDDVGDKGNLAFPLITGDVIDEALKLAGLVEDEMFVADFLKYREIEQKARDIQLKANEIASEFIQNGYSLNEAMQKAGFIKSDKLRNILDTLIAEEKKKNPYFPYSFIELEKEDEEIDGLLMGNEYECNNSMVAYYGDLKKYEVDELLNRCGGIKYFLELLSNTCEFIKENTRNLIKVQNKIIDLLNYCRINGDVVFQLLMLQGISEWMKKINVNEGKKGFDEAQALYDWIIKRLFEVYYFYQKRCLKDENTKGLDEYLKNTEINNIYKNVFSLRIQCTELTEKHIAEINNSNININTKEENNQPDSKAREEAIEKIIPKHVSEAYRDELIHIFSYGKVNKRRIDWKDGHKALYNELKPFFDDGTITHLHSTEWTHFIMNNFTKNGKDIKKQSLMNEKNREYRK